MKIKETQALFDKVGTELLVRPIIGSTEDKTCSTYYEVKTESGEILASGNTTLTEEEYAAWGSDNTYIEDLVLNQLNLERLEEEFIEEEPIEEPTDELPEPTE